MQAEDRDPENQREWEEPSSMLWGLDPMFNAYTRLYVKDILQMRESCQVPGIYFYNSRPIFKVDVLGTVVYKREREDFFCYGVDDGTGVINCLCWKNEQCKDQGDSATLWLASSAGAGAKALGSSTGGGFDPGKELKKLQQAQCSRSNLDIGELLRVRGPVKSSRHQREVMASMYYKVSDPLMITQISWMMEVPRLYRECYDKPLRLDPGAQDPNTQGCAQKQSDSSSAASLLGKATRILKDFLKDREVTRFRPYDIQEILQPLVSSQPQKTMTRQEPEAGSSSGPSSSSNHLRQLLKESLQTLIDEGLVFRKVKSQDEVYHVTEQDKNLLMAIRDVIKEDCRREKYAERGCHALHILSSVRQRYSHNVSRAALELALKALECNSDIISTRDSHYTVF